MRVTRRSQTELLVQDSTIWLAVVSCAAALLLTGTVALQGNRAGWGGAAVFLLFGVMWVRKTSFLFDSVRRTVSWHRLAVFKSSAGTLSFDDITGVGEEASSSVSGTQTYRLTLLLRGSSMPMSDSYGGGRHWHDKIRTQILEFVGGTVTANSGLDDSVRSLLRQRRKIDAVSLVRTEERISLTEAVRRVDSIEEQMKADAAR